MIGEKRGFLIVVVLVILLSFSGLSGNWAGHCAAEQCVSIAVGVTDCPWCDTGLAESVIDVSCNDPEPGDDEEGMCKSYAAGETGQIPITDTEECVIDGHAQPVAGGCWFILGEYDWDLNGCGVGHAVPGAKWGNGHGPGFSGGFNSIATLTSDFDEVEEDLLNNLYIEDPWEYICTDSGLWAPCYQTSQEGNQVVVAGKTYICKYDGFAYVWSTDGDRDGYNTGEDCDDDASDDDLYGIGVECPVLPAEEVTGKTNEDIRKAARSLCESDPGRFSHCAICINNGAAEVCGDNINNDCGGPGEKEKVDELVGVTADNCHENQASCEQGFIGHCSESNVICTSNSDCNVDGGEECNLPSSAEQATGVCKYIGSEACTGNDASSCGTQGEYTCEEGKCKYIANE